MRVDRAVWQIETQDAEVGLPTGRTRFPDVVLTRKPTRHAPHPEDKRLILLNPTVAIEVASESTAAVDEDDKPGDYLSVSSITDYLIFEQDRRRVRHRRRADATPATWDVETLTGPDAAVRLAGPAVEFSLADVYEGVTFPAG